MKRRSICLSVIFFALLPIPATFADAREVIIAPDDVHVPQGFDSNDRVEILITGELPDNCHKEPFGNPKIDGNKIAVDMKATKISGKDTVCIQALVPYLVRVPLGPLSEGSYDIAINEGKASEIDSILVVSKPNSTSVDNFDYANVTSVKKAPGKDALILQGSHPSGCTKITNVEVVPNAIGNTYAILPIVKNESEICDRMMKPFTYELPIPSTVKNDVVVFHVRKKNGNAINVRW